MKFRKKPVVIEAIQWTGINTDEIRLFTKSIEDSVWFAPEDEEISLKIKTLEGTMEASLGDWIIKGVSGEFYPCKPDIFEKTYEKVD